MIFISRWWFQLVLFSSLLREMIQFDEHIFQMGWFNHQPVHIFYPPIFQPFFLQIVVGLTKKTGRGGHGLSSLGCIADHRVPA